MSLPSSVNHDTTSPASSAADLDNTFSICSGDTNSAQRIHNLKSVSPKLINLLKMCKGVQHVSEVNSFCLISSRHAGWYSGIFLTSTSFTSKRF